MAYTEMRQGSKNKLLQFSLQFKSTLNNWHGIAECPVGDQPRELIKLAPLIYD